MTRKEFIKNSLGLGIGLPFLSNLLSACEKDDSIIPSFQTSFEGKVFIIGAGAAGMAAGYLLKRYGVDFQIIEASDRYGGRVKRNNSLADFPIDVGAEWIHDNPSILAELVNDPTVNGEIEIITYNPKTIAVWNNGALRERNFARYFYSEYKFKNTTWYDFFERYIVPSIEDHMIFNTPIVEIDSSAEKVKLMAQDNTIFEADRILITVPIKVLQTNMIRFVPTLPTTVQNSIDSVYMGDGFKAFIEFKERFYPDILMLGSLLEEASAGDKIYYDAAFGKASNRHILGLFSVNEKAAAYANFDSEEEALQKILSELDEVFEGKASEHYVSHVIQNWTKEPYIQGSYSTEYDDISALSESVDNKIYFAGELLGGNNQSTVHGACQSGYAQVEKILQS